MIYYKPKIVVILS